MGFESAGSGEANVERKWVERIIENRMGGGSREKRIALC